MKHFAAAAIALLLLQAPALADVSIIDAGPSYAQANHTQSNEQTQNTYTDQSDNRGVTVNQGGGDADASIDDRGGGNEEGAILNANVQAPIAVATGPILSPNVIVANNDILSNKSNNSTNSQTSSNSDSSRTDIDQSKSYTVTDTSRSGNTASSIDRSVIFLPSRSFGDDRVLTRDRIIERDINRAIGGDSILLLGSRKSCCTVKEFYDTEGKTLPFTGLPSWFMPTLWAALLMVATGLGLDYAGLQRQKRKLFFV